MYFYTNSRTNLSTLFEVVGDCYDSLPAVNSDTSLPILYKGVCSFPNYRYSFYPYGPKAHYRRKYENPYYEELDNNPYPYGYEHEACFIKHDTARPYRPGKHVKEFIRSTGKFIDAYLHLIHISYVKKSNTFIVKSSFDRSKRHVFFKQTNKLITTVDDQPKWNSYQNLSIEFRREILKHLETTDVKLHSALSSVPAYIKDFRTVLNNPFWKDTQATFLLSRDKDFKKLKRSCQYYYRKNKNYFEVNKTFEGFPEEFIQAILTTPDIRLSDISALKEIHEYVDSVHPSLANSGFIKLDQFQFRWTTRNYNNIQADLSDPIFKKFFLEVKDHFKSLISTIEAFNKLKKNLNLVSLSFPHTLSTPNKPYLQLMDELEIHIRQSGFNKSFGMNTREVVKLKDKSELIINPSLSEIINCIGNDANLVSNPPNNPQLYLHDDILYSNYKDFLCNSGLGFIMENADILSTKMPSFKEILKGNLNFGLEKPTNILDDDLLF